MNKSNNSSQSLLERCWSEKFPPLNLYNFPIKMISGTDIHDYKDARFPQPEHSPAINEAGVFKGTLKIDPVNHPKHYTEHPSGVECITITQHMPFVLGNAMKYIWRADLKNGLEDLKKARWYLDLEIKRRGG